MHFLAIHKLFERQAYQTPEAIAISFENENITYQQLNERANQIAWYLMGQGVQRETLVGVCFDRGPLAIAGILGIFKAGGAYVPLDPNYPQERLNFMIRDSGLQFLLVEKNTRVNFQNYQGHTFCLDSLSEELNQENIQNTAVDSKPEDLAYLIYTSGSTGRPNGVLIEHKGIPNIVEDHIEKYHLDGSSKVLQFASLNFDASVVEIGMALLSGGELTMATAETLTSENHLIDFLNNKRVTHATFPPTILSYLTSEKLPHLKVVTVTGEACPDQLVKEWSKGKKFFNGYGPTEVTVGATMASFSEGDSKSVIGFLRR